MNPADDKQAIETFIRLLTSNQERIYAYILSLVAARSDADDIMQETTTVMWRKFDQFRPGSDFAAWGMTIARYKVMSFRKQNRNRPTRLSDETIESLEAELKDTLGRQDDRLDALKLCIQKLSRIEANLIRLRYYEEVSAQDIARRIGKHVRTVYKLFSRIQTRLLYCVREAMAD